MYKSLGHLCSDIGISRNKFNEVCKDTSKYYRSFSIVKLKPDGKPKLNRDGSKSVRKIDPSFGDLKLIQQRLNSKIFSQIEYDPCVHGGISEKDNLSNAIYHKGNKYFFITDIKSFFPYVNSWDVYSALIDLSFSENLARKITLLTTFNGHVPQGAPTSTAIANIVFIQIDRIISEFCNNHNLVYTRFVDDITVSGKKDFKNLGVELISIISGFGYKVARNKTHFKIGRVDITGISLGNNYLNVSNGIYQKLDERRSEASKAGLIQYRNRVINKGRKKNSCNT